MTASTNPADPVVRRLGAGDVAALHELNSMFARAFDDPGSYTNRRPDDSYIATQLTNPHVIALVAEDHGIIGGLVAYVLPKLEQARSEVYIYDLAVAAPHRRRGVAISLIRELQAIARGLGAWVIYVQADYGDEPAIALYTKLGVREDVMHFDVDLGE